MPTFLVVANGSMMGEYHAESAADALDAYARDASYADYADVVSQFGDEATARRIDDGALCVSVAKVTGHLVYQDGYGGGVALIDGVSYPDYESVARLIGRDITDFADVA